MTNSSEVTGDVTDLLFLRLPQTQSLLVQRWPPSAVLRKDPVTGRERCSQLGDSGGEERGHGRVLCLHQQCSRFCLFLSQTNCSKYVFKWLKMAAGKVFKENANLCFPQGPGEIVPQDKRGNLTFSFQLKWLLCLFYLWITLFDRFQGASCSASLPWKIRQQESEARNQHHFVRQSWRFVVCACLTMTLIWDQFKQLCENVIRLSYSYGLLAEGRINGRCPVD